MPSLRFVLTSLTLVAVAAVAVAAQVGVRQLTLPRRPAVEPWMTRILENPGQSGLRLRHFNVTTRDGYQLQALMADPTAKAGATARGRPIVKALKAAGLAGSASGSGSGTDDPEPRGTVILLHGMSTRKENMLPVAERFAAAGFRCILYDSRGHGDSSGVHVTYGTYETEDLRRVLLEAKKMAGLRGLGPVGLFGYSLGGAVALQAQPGLPEVKAVCSVSAFAELSPVVSGQAENLWNGIASRLLPVVRFETWLQAGFDPFSVSPLASAAQVTCPVLLVHGLKDNLVPVQQARNLAAALGPHCRDTILVPAGTHGGIFTEGGEALQQRIAVFFARELAPPRALPAEPAAVSKSKSKPKTKVRAKAIASR
ncbi:MAG: alpha/beta fold hydrolase [Verrucomicrobiaceae bacterium]|nr:MAG: alpha/beta fold hydrolase [Verrucomicrobiaceae bacterium]